MGKGANKPLVRGPRIEAAPVKPNTKAVATSMRKGVSHLGGVITNSLLSRSGINVSATIRNALTIANEKSRGKVILSSINVSAKNAIHPPSIAMSQPERNENQ